MKARRTMLGIGYSVLGAGMGLAAGSNMLDELPPGLSPVTFVLLAAGLAIIVAGRLFPPERQISPAPNPDRPLRSD